MSTGVSRNDAERFGQGERTGQGIGALRQATQAYLLFFTLAVALQWMCGAYRSEFGGHPDEAAHVVTGLMVRDYLFSSDWLKPLDFAKNYYAHYPKVALGHWPPFFYVVQAAWTSVFGPSHASLLLLMAALTAALALSLSQALSQDKEYPPGIGIAAGTMLVVSPIVQQSTSIVMADVTLTLLSFWAARCFGRYVESPGWREATAFGLCATLAILTKAGGLALALIPPLTILLTRRFDLLARLSFWWPAVLVAAFCGPWYWLTLDMASNGMIDGGKPNLKFLAAAFGHQSANLLNITGLGMALLAVVGLTVRLNGPCRVKWATAASLAAGMLLFHCIVPGGTEARYLIPILPPLLMFAAAGFAWLARSSGFDRPPAWRTAAIGLLAAIAFAAETFTIQAKNCQGFAEAAQALLSTPGCGGPSWLVSSDSRGEGAFIAEVALRERRPEHTISRSSKVISQSDWLGQNYKSLVNSGEEVLDFLEDAGITAIVLDTESYREPYMLHHLELLKAIHSGSARWRLLKTQPRTRNGIHRSNIEIFVRNDGN